MMAILKEWRIESKKDLKRYKNRPKVIEKLESILGLLQNEMLLVLLQRYICYRQHSFRLDYNLIWRVDNGIIFVHYPSIGVYYTVLFQDSVLGMDVTEKMGFKMKVR